MDDKKRKVNVRVNHSDEAFFTDNVTVFHNPTKFVVDFCQTVPRFDNFEGRMEQTFTVNHKTIIMDPMFAKILLKTLETNVSNYEKNFGMIKVKKKREKKVTRTEAETQAPSTRYIG